MDRLWPCVGPTNFMLAAHLTTLLCMASGKTLPDCVSSINCTVKMPSFMWIHILPNGSNCFGKFLLTLQVSRYCLLALQSSLPPHNRGHIIYGNATRYNSIPLSCQCHLNRNRGRLKVVFNGTNTSDDCRMANACSCSTGDILLCEAKRPYLSR